jgi:hypothetical protein
MEVPMATTPSQVAFAPAENKRGVFLTVIAVLLAILAVSDFTKTLQHLRDPHLGLVVLGHRFTTVPANVTMGTLFGLMLAVYASGVWRMRRWVLPLSIAYAFYVPVNLVLFWSLHENGHPSVGFILFYLAVSLTGSIGTAIYLSYHRERLS